MDEYEANERIIKLAIGRIFRLMSRPYQAGDIADYERARAALLRAYDENHGRACGHDPQPNYARDRLKGAPGE